MKLLGINLLAGLSMVVATNASAQKEQWLQYQTSREGRGYRWLDLTTTAPTNVVLPKLNATPYFARFTTALDPTGGRWLCFDRTRKSGPYDRLFIDARGDGKFDEKNAVGTWRTDQYSSYFEPAKVVFKGEDGPITYHLAVRFMKYDGEDQPRALASSAGFYSGQIDFGGKKKRVELIDANVNGTFNDQPYDADRIQVEGDKGGERYLGKLVEVGGVFYQIEVARDGASIKLKRAENVVLGKVQVPETISQVVALGENGHFFRSPVKGEFTLPAGKYRLQDWTIDRKDSKGVAWQLSGSGFDESASFLVAEGKPARLEIGEPVHLTLTPRESANRVDFSLGFQGRYGETISVMKGDQRPPGPKLTLASLDGTYRSTNTFEFG